MKSFVFIVALIILTGCNHTVAPPAQSAPEVRANPIEGRLKRDQELRKRFTKIANGMTESEVLNIMGNPPHEITRKTTWAYKLSRASDSLTEWHQYLCGQDAPRSQK